MKIDEGLITYLEELSRLQLTDSQREETMGTLGRILEYFTKLDELDTAGVEELSHPFSATNRFREDAAKDSFDRNTILASAPKQKDGCFQVPKTVE